MRDRFIISEEEAGELRKALAHAITLLQYVGDRLGKSTLREGSSDYPLDEIRARAVVSVRGLRNNIKDMLRQAGRPLRSMDLVDFLYHRSMGITKDRFARKVIVSISLMHKEGNHGIKKVAMEGRDALWTIDAPAPIEVPMTHPSRPEEESDQTTFTLPSRANERME